VATGSNSIGNNSNTSLYNISNLTFANIFRINDRKRQQETKLPETYHNNNNSSETHQLLRKSRLRPYTTNGEINNHLETSTRGQTYNSKNSAFRLHDSEKLDQSNYIRWKVSRSGHNDTIRASVSEKCYEDRSNRNRNNNLQSLQETLFAAEQDIDGMPLFHASLCLMLNHFYVIVL
jgi:hypothetical protein